MASDEHWGWTAHGSSSGGYALTEDPIYGWFFRIRAMASRSSLALLTTTPREGLFSHANRPSAR